VDLLSSRIPHYILRADFGHLPPRTVPIFFVMYLTLGDDVAFAILDWVDWTGICTLLLLIVLLALVWVWWYRDRD
jgi:hypothetical protein